MALSDSLKTDMSGISPLINAARSPKETPQSLVKMPAAPKFGGDDVGTMEGILSIGKERLANLQTQQANVTSRQQSFETDISNLTAQKLSYDRQKEEFGAKQREEEARLNYENIKKMFDDEVNSQGFKEKQRINKEIAEYSVFVPTEVTAPMLGVLFSAIGAAGMLLGGNSKNNAKAALSAMNGMAEGFGKGREQYDKERKQAFDSNLKLLQSKLTAVKDGLEDARREAVLNKQAADQKVRETLAANETQFLKENYNGRGLESTIALVNGQLKSLNHAADLLSTKTNQLSNELQREAIQVYLKKADIASRESQSELNREQRARDAELMRQSQAQGRDLQLRLAQLRLSEAGTRRDVKALQDIGPALRNIAVNYPDGTANSLVGSSADDKKKIQGAFRALQESEETADFIAKNPRAVGALAKLRNVIKIDAIKSLKSDDESQTVAGKSAIVESQIDDAAQRGIVTKDEAEAAKILEKRLFGLALADVQGSGQRGSVYLDRQFQNLYDQASRPDTLLKVIKERSGENNRNLKVYKLGVERHENPELFPLTLSETQNDFNKYIQERSPAPRQDHIEKLKKDPSPKMKKFFDEAYGEGSANRILGSK
jgi:hypothetical protein